MTNVTIAEGKKNFSRLITDSLEKEEEILVTRRGRPVVVIVPYEHYQRSRKRQGYEKIMEAKNEFEKSGIEAEKIPLITADEKLIRAVGKEFSWITRLTDFRIS